MKIIDTHLHLWNINRISYPWLDEVPAIKKTFLIEDYQQAAKDFEITNMVFVQCDCVAEQSLEEISFVREQAAKDARIKGMVAFAPIEKGKAAADYLDEITKDNFVKSIRRMTGNEPGLTLTQNFIDGTKLLSDYNLNCDICIKPHQAEEYINYIKQCPETFFVLDHLGKPDIAHNKLEEFKKNIGAFAALPNVIAKVSGLITEADWQNWNTETLKPYIIAAIDAFGFDRLIYGGDWPVALLAGSYSEWLKSLLEILQDYKDEDVNKMLYSKAIKFYKLD